jgi:hypothetical protein
VSGEGAADLSSYIFGRTWNELCVEQYRDMSSAEYPSHTIGDVISLSSDVSPTSSESIMEAFELAKKKEDA